MRDAPSPLRGFGGASGPVPVRRSFSEGGGELHWLGAAEAMPFSTSEARLTSATRFCSDWWYVSYAVDARVGRVTGSAMSQHRMNATLRITGSQDAEA